MTLYHNHISTLLTKARKRLEHNLDPNPDNLGNPDLDARLLLEGASGLSQEELLCQEEPISAQKIRLYESYIERRLKNEPVSRILGQRFFWSHPFALAQNVFDPRPESELMIEVAQARLTRNPPTRELPPRNLASRHLESRDSNEAHILDLGTGTGCLLLSLLSLNEGFRGIGIDCSLEAIALARRNARALGLSPRAHFLYADWRIGLMGRFDVILCNPPYIPTLEIAQLAKEVKDYDPIIALDGGEDGLDSYRILAQNIHLLLKKDGYVIIEIGKDQKQIVMDLFASQFEGEVFRDLSGIERVICLERKPLKV